MSTTLNGNPKPLASVITYLPFGGITGLTYGNNLTLVRGYDNQYRTSSIAVGSLLSRTYGYDPNGNVTSIINSIEPAGNQALEKTGAYIYVSGTNLLAEITGEDPKLLDYDQNGNTTVENNRVYTYDASNQLIRVRDGTTPVAEYIYNGSGQRIKKILPIQAPIFHYDLAGHIIAETDQSGQMLAEYIYLNDQLLAMIRPGENVYYYHNDHLGTPQILTDASGNIAWKATYTPFGAAQISIETIENPFRFPGQYYDPETGLHYNYFRYYNPQTGRYITPDPIGLWGGINLFSYVQGNPVNLIDPKGLIEIQPEVPGKIVPEIIEFMVDKSIGGLAGYECASHFCKAKQIPSDKLTQVWALCGSILERRRLPTGIGSTTDIIDACAETCWKVTHSERFKKNCNICEK